MEKQVASIRLDEFEIKDPQRRSQQKQNEAAQQVMMPEAAQTEKKPGLWAQRFGRTVKRANILDRLWGSDDSRNTNDTKKTMALVLKFVAAAAICFAVFLLTLSGSPTARKITEGLNSAINYTVDIDETLGKLKLVDADSNASQTSAASWNMQMPILATIQSSFDDTGEGILLKGAKDSLVGAAASGYVLAVGKDVKLGNFVKVRHSDTLETVYFGLSEVVVEENDVVDRGSELGTTDKGTLRFEIRVNGVPVDPMDYVKVA